MSDSTILVFTPDGNAVGLYTEIIDLQELGVLRVTRASSIEFEDKMQAWRVKDRKGLSLFTSPSHRECIEWEQDYFNNKLERGIHDGTD